MFAGRSCMFNICTDTFSAFSDMFATSCYFRCSSIFDGRSGMFWTFWRTCPACCFYQYVFCHVPACLMVAPACLTFVRTRFLLFWSDMSGMLFLPICVLPCSSMFDGRSCMFNICTDTFSAFSDMFATSCYFRCSSIFDGRSGMFLHLVGHVRHVVFTHMCSAMFQHV